MKGVFVVVFCCLPMLMHAQGNAETGNRVTFRILTGDKEYLFESLEMTVRLNVPLNQFEFSVPVATVSTISGSGELPFFREFTAGNELLTLEAKLPAERDDGLDLSYFKGGKILQLPCTVTIGKNVFHDLMDFNGLLMKQNQAMAFHINVFLTRAELDALRFNGQPVVEIEIVARGDKLLGLTSK